MLWKEDARVGTSPSCSLDPTRCPALFSRESSCARPASVKHIISVFLHAIMQDMLVIAMGSALSKHCYSNVSIRKSQLKSSVLQEPREVARVRLRARLNAVRTGKTVLRGPSPPRSAPPLLSTDFTDLQKRAWACPKAINWWPRQITAHPFSIICHVTI